MSRLETHYGTVRERHGYDRAAGVDWLSDAGLSQRFVAVDDREAVAAARDRATLVCAGVGMTGPPHLGTVGQILTAVELQAAGLDVQFVLADLEPYHGGAGWARVRGLAERYRQFALDRGFDPEQGTLRTQSEAREVMATGHRLARYYRPDEWDDGVDHPATDWERAVSDAYDRGRSDDSAGSADDDSAGSADDDSAGSADDGGSGDGPTSAAASAHSAVLHGADFLHPLLEGGYEQVVVALGIDEHGLTPWTRRFRDATPVEGAVAGLHSRMVPCLEGGPKMSKSIGAGVSLDTDPEAIRERIRGAAGGGDGPGESAVFGAMCLASRYDAADLGRLEAACAAGGEDWAAARAEYADYVAGLAERWRATA